MCLSLPLIFIIIFSIFNLRPALRVCYIPKACLVSIILWPLLSIWLERSSVGYVLASWIPLQYYVTKDFIHPSSIFFVTVFSQNTDTGMYSSRTIKVPFCCFSYCLKQTFILTGFLQVPSRHLCSCRYRSDSLCVSLKAYLV